MLLASTRGSLVLLSGASKEGNPGRAEREKRGMTPRPAPTLGAPEPTYVHMPGYVYNLIHTYARSRSVVSFPCLKAVLARALLPAENVPADNGPQLLAMS